MNWDAIWQFVNAANPLAHLDVIGWILSLALAAILLWRWRASRHGVTGPSKAKKTPGVHGATIAAIVASMLAYNAIHGFVVTVLHMHVIVAIGLAGFLEMAAISSALLARDAIRAQRDPRPDHTATWIFATVSATIAVLYELVDPNTQTWDITAVSIVSAIFRFLPALAACWLWGRALRADRAHAENELPRSERLRLRRIALVAQAAQRVRRLENLPAGSLRTTALTFAQWRKDRLKDALNLRYPAITDLTIDQDLDTMLRQYARLDELPELDEQVATPRHLPTHAPQRPWTPTLTVALVAAISIAAMALLPATQATIVASAALLAGAAIVIAHLRVSSQATGEQVDPAAPITPARGVPRIPYSEGKSVVNLEVDRVIQAACLHHHNPAMTNGTFAEAMGMSDSTARRHRYAAKKVLEAMTEPITDDAIAGAVMALVDANAETEAAAEEALA